MRINNRFSQGIFFSNIFVKTSFYFNTIKKTQKLIILYTIFIIKVCERYLLTPSVVFLSVIFCHHWYDYNNNYKYKWIYLYNCADCYIEFLSIKYCYGIIKQEERMTLKKNIMYIDVKPKTFFLQNIRVCWSFVDGLYDSLFIGNYQLFLLHR